MSLIWSAKRPDAVADYKVNWTTELSGDTIATSSFTFVDQAGLTKDSEANDSTSSTIWLSGGTAGLVAKLQNTITTAGGRTLIEDIALPISTGLVVEDGSGILAADAFVSVDYCVAYCAAHGIAFSGELADQERSIRNGAKWLTFQPAWKGDRVKYRLQGLAWPRVGADDRDGYPILSTEIPFEVMYANCELAAYDLANPGALFPTVVLADRVRREKVGPIEVEYAPVPVNDPNSNRPWLTKVSDLLAGLLDESGGGSMLQGVADRA